MNAPEAPDPSPAPSSAPAPRGLDLPEFLALLYRERALVLAVWGIVLALFVLYALTATPIYRADALLRVEKPSANLSATGFLAGALFSGASSTRAEIDILRSRAVLFPVIRRLGLGIAIRSPRGRRYDALEARIAHRSLVIGRWHIPPALEGRKLRLVSAADGRFLLETRHGRRILAGRVGTGVHGPGGLLVEVTRLEARPGATYTVVRRPAEGVEPGLLGGLSAFENGVRTGIVEVALEGPHPRWLARVVDAIDREFLAENVAARATRARQSLRFVEHELPRLRRRLDRATARFDRFRSRRRIVALSVQTRAVFAELTRLEETLTAIRLRLADLEESYRAGFPLVRALVREKSRLESLRASLLARLRTLPLEEQTYLRLKRDVVIATGLYVALLKKAQELEVEKAGTVGDVRLVEPAVVPDRPVKPDRRLVVELGFLLGGLLAVGAVFLKRTLVHGVDDPDEVEEIFRLPHYALIPHSPRQARSARRVRKAGILPLLARTAPDDPAVEALRSLRLSLTVAARGAFPATLTVGGLRTGVGKSFVAANLGYLLAASGRRVLLVDADLHRGKLLDYFGTGELTGGLSELLQGRGEWRTFLRVHPDEERLRLLPAGSRVSHPARLFENADIARLLDELAQAFDTVLVDLPPYLPVNDGLHFARHAALNLLVLKAGIHPLAEIRHGLGKLAKAGIPVAGFVMNDIRRGMRNYRYYGYGGEYRRERTSEG